MQLARLLRRLDKPPRLRRGASRSHRPEGDGAASTSRSHSKRPEKLSENVDISGLACDSRAVRKGSLFVAIDGTKVKGSDFIAEAIKKGASCVVSANGRTALAKTRVPVIHFSDTRYALAVLADEFFGHPSGKLKVIGVTGTNGKTTITYLIRSILQEAHFSCGIIGTVGYSFEEKIIPTQNTTPGPLGLQMFLKQMVRAGCAYCVMEVSSHGLDQQRTRAIDFKAALFTNLTHDHLDYHLNLENYFSAKARLFRELNKDAFSIINADSPYAGRLTAVGRGKLITFGIDSACDIRARNLSLDLAGSEFILHTKKRKTKIKTRLIGRHNISNVLAAIAFGLSQKIELARIVRAVENFNGVKGRLERVRAQERNVFIDYAHTPDALMNVLAALKALSGGNLTVVFGCGGERDAFKRPLMGELAQKYADKVIITSDNPRSEEPQKIADEITLRMRGGNYRVILERKEAIACALSASKAGDTILIAGKGHEDYQILKDRKIEFDDAIVTGQLLRQMGL